MAKENNPKRTPQKPEPAGSLNEPSATDRENRNDSPVSVAGIFLTEKELEMLRYFCSDLSYKEIAARTGLSTRTVQGYRNILCSKIGVQSRIGLVIYAIRAGIVKV